MLSVGTRTLGFALLAFLLAGCNEQAGSDAAAVPVAVASGDECHLCGMLILEFPGPKGELYLRNDTAVKKFCSTRDLFAMVLDPEYQHQVRQIFVHDMGKSPWQTPDDSAFIDGKTAWYVLGSARDGAMGHTLASFGEREAAERFARDFGGSIKRFEELTVSSL
ncbi:nitrous oxide reductase accessory protein NosL [Shewanella sp.]|uniref:nitrous oxide reductase accessory protein NosL n=1 Tax=Shewanella sp. TaxID=50422 RepID=UPI003564A3E8